MSKYKGIVLPSDSEYVQRSLFANIKREGLDLYPPLSTGEANVRRVVMSATPEEGLGYDLEFSGLQAEIVGVATTKEAAACRWNPELGRWIDSWCEEHGIAYVGHSVLSADKPILEYSAKIKTDRLRWRDSLLTFWLAHHGMTKMPAKEEDTESLGLMNLGVMGMLHTDLPMWKKCRGKDCDEYVCPSHWVENYCSVDAYVGLVGELECKKILAAKNVPAVVLSDLHELQEISLAMQSRGTSVDHEYIGRLDLIMAEEQAKLFAPKGDPEYRFNPKSPKEVIAWFAEKKIKLPKTDKDAVQTALEKQAREEGWEHEKFEDLRLFLDECIEAGDPMPEHIRALADLHSYKMAGKGTKSWFDPKYFGEDGRLHPRFVITGTSTGRLSSSRPNVQNCFSPDTEVLTDRGWVLFPLLQDGDKVAQWDAGKIEYVEHGGLQVIPHRGELVALSNQHIDLLVTPEHRCPLVNRKTGELKVHRADDYPEDKKQLHAGIWEGGEDTLSLPQLRLLIATQADGHFVTVGGKPYGVSYTFRKKRKIEALRKVLKTLKADFSEVRDEKRNRTKFYVRLGDTNSWLRETLGSKKQLPRLLLRQSLKTRRFIFEELTKWDGEATRGSAYYSKDGHNADLVQELAVGLGYRTTKQWYVNAHGGACWLVYLTRRDYSLTTNVDKKTIPYSGFVYCTSVPSTFLVMRREGKVCVSGNCPKRGWGKKIRHAFVPLEDNHFLLEADFSQLELRVILYLAGVDQSIIGADAFTWLVSQSGGLFDRAAQKYGGKPRDIAKIISHSSNYLMGFKLLSLADLRTLRIKKEIEVGALRLYTKEHYPDLDHDWMYGGKYVAFTGAHMAASMFGNKTLESRAKALEIQEDIYFKAFPMIRRWQQEETEKAERNGYVQSPVGRFLELDDAPEKNAKLTVAFLGQGTGADHSTAVMLEYKRQMGIIPMGMVHDSLLHSLPKSMPVDEVWQIVEFMSKETPRLPGFTCPVKAEVGPRWGTMYELEKQDAGVMMKLKDGWVPARWEW